MQVMQKKTPHTNTINEVILVILFQYLVTSKKQFEASQVLEAFTVFIDPEYNVVIRSTCVSSLVVSLILKRRKTTPYKVI